MILDTSVIIDYERRSREIHALASRKPQEPVRLSVITAAELLHGVHRAESVGRRARRSTFVEHVLSLFPIIDFDLAIARLYSELWATLEKQGKRISAHDLIIGATALANDESVATFDKRDFTKIPGLRVEVIH